MPARTLLQVVQNVLSAMEADNVNSISDTVESVAIARVAEETFFELISQSDWPHLEVLETADSHSSLESPNVLRIPKNIKNIKGFWYDGSRLKYLPIEEFIEMSNQLDVSKENVVLSQVGANTYLNCYNDTAPRVFTLVGDSLVVTDSYNSNESSTLLGHKSLISGTETPYFELDDNFVPKMPDSMLSTYLAMVKRSAFLYFRREPSTKDERAALAGMSKLLRNKSSLYNKSSRVNYGRNK